MSVIYGYNFPRGAKFIIVLFYMIYFRNFSDPFLLITLFINNFFNE